MMIQLKVRDMEVLGQQGNKENNIMDLDFNTVKEIYNGIKKWKGIVHNIDTDFYLKSTSILLERIEKLEQNKGSEVNEN